MDHDVLVVGSGFGGAVTALRLTEKGYRVGVLEAGRRFADHELPRTSWQLRDYLFAPGIGCTGIQRITLLRDVLVLSGAGVGGGSLVYANTLYQPPESFFRDQRWAHITDWRSELAPHYDQASRMLGVVDNPCHTAADRLLRDVAAELGVETTFRPSRVGVHFGPNGGDPFFGGAGPRRNGCIACGACMTGCRHNAKNTLPKNYLHLAERAGAEVWPLTTVLDVRPRGGGGYAVRTRRTGGRAERVFAGGQVVFAAASLGTQRLLHGIRDHGGLPGLSPRLGALCRTNSEAVVAVRTPGGRIDHSRGLAITSSMHPDTDTHVEVVRYGRGSNLMGLLMTTLTDGGPARLRRGLAQLRAEFRTALRLHMPHRWAGGIPRGSWTDLVNVPLTGHLIGGCVIGDSPDTGVIDPYHRMHGHPGLHVVDGSAIPANLGVNPAPTITALAERAMSLWPNKDEPDTRPRPGAPYRRLRAVVPRNPAVPATAPAALRHTDEAADAR